LAWGRLAAHDPARVEEFAASRLPASSKVTSPRTLEAVVAQRVRFLTNYQNEKYARRYSELVQKAASAERSIGAKDHRLADAVARYYFKVLAVKDEFEVMRLWASTGFRRQLEREFEGDYKIQVHLAPQIFFPRDRETGRARKITLNQSVMTVLKWLRHLKFLRNTPFDPFNWTTHRRREWALVEEYENVVDELLRDLALENHELAIQIAEIPEHVRGFDTVKDLHMEAAKEKEAELLAAFRR
jgi:indolepyruvate ferredoxin oxidoreductase